MAIATHEKIETIVDCFLAHRTQFGQYGYLIERSPCCYKVCADGYTVYVRATASGWRVSRGSIVAINANLLEAARDAVLAR